MATQGGECSLVLAKACSVLHTARMIEPQTLATRIREFSQISGMSPTTLSRKLLGNGQRLAEIEAGGDLGMRVYRRASEMLDQMAHDLASTASANAGSTGNNNDLSAGTKGVAASPGDATAAHAEAGGASSLSGGCEGRAA